MSLWMCGRSAIVGWQLTSCLTKSPVYEPHSSLSKNRNDVMWWFMYIFASFKCDLSLSRAGYTDEINRRLHFKVKSPNASPLVASVVRNASVALKVQPEFLCFCLAVLLLLTNSRLEVEASDAYMFVNVSTSVHEMCFCRCFGRLVHWVNELDVDGSEFRLFKKQTHMMMLGSGICHLLAASSKGDNSIKLDKKSARKYFINLYLKYF